MIVEFGIQPNCSECAFVIYTDGISEKQRRFINRFIKSRKLDAGITPKKNLTILSNYKRYPKDKSDLWDLSNDFEELMKWENIEAITYDLIRDESYDDLIEDNQI
jgi:hypothetical protein